MNMLLDLFINVTKFTCFGELYKSNVIAIQRLSFFFLGLSKVVDFIGDVCLWRNKCIKSFDRRVI